MSRVAVRRSPIHGKGLFAVETIRKGTYIGHYYGPRTDRDSMYTLWVEHGDEDVGFEERGYKGTGRLRHMNHSSRPNAEMDGRDCYAIRTIRPGDEILIHYGDEWDDIP